MKSTAVMLEGPRKLSLCDVRLVDPSVDDLVVEIKHSGISTGTEKLFYTGEMPLAKSLRHLPHPVSKLAIMFLYPAQIATTVRLVCLAGLHPA